MLLWPHVLAYCQSVNGCWLDELASHELDIIQTHAHTWNPEKLCLWPGLSLEDIGKYMAMMDMR